MRLEGQNYYYGAHTDAPDVLDPYTNQRRPCLEEDVRRNAVLIDGLPNINFTTASGLVADREAEVADRVSLAQCLIYSTKPVLAMPVSLRALIDCRELAALAAGGEDALRAKPLLIVYAEPVSPLVHPDETVRKLLYCAEYEIPLVYTPYAAMGGTAPLSQAAIIAQICAESLSGLVIHQLKRPGAPFIFGGMPSVMDMKTTIFSYGAPEFQLGNSLMAEMAHYFNLPNFGTAGTSDSQIFDGQAVLEATSSCMMAALSGANLVHDVGLLGNATVVIPDMIVATDEIINMTYHIFPEVNVNEETLAVNIIRDVGPGGEFVTHPHTLHHFRDVWYPDLLHRGGARAWNESDQLTFEQRVNARTRDLIESHQPEPLAVDVIEQITDVLRRAEAYQTRSAVGR
jgi:trimethylamine--corrinoid protein Co-methyltransferase